MVLSNMDFKVTYSLRPTERFLLRQPCFPADFAGRLSPFGWPRVEKLPHGTTLVTYYQQYIAAVAEASKYRSYLREGGAGCRYIFQHFPMDGLTMVLLIDSVIRSFVRSFIHPSAD